MILQKGLEELKELLYSYYSKKMDESLNELCNWACLTRKDLMKSIIWIYINWKCHGYAAAEYVIKTILNSKFTEMITPFYNFNLIEADKDDNNL